MLPSRNFLPPFLPSFLYICSLSLFYTNNIPSLLPTSLPIYILYNCIFIQIWLYSTDPISWTFLHTSTHRSASFFWVFWVTCWHSCNGMYPLANPSWWTFWMFVSNLLLSQTSLEICHCTLEGLYLQDKFFKVSKLWRASSYMFAKPWTYHC